MKKDFTVILTRPDYMVEDIEDRVYVAYVQAETAVRAVAVAQRQAYNTDKDRSWISNNITDYALVVVFSGYASAELWG